MTEYFWDYPNEPIGGGNPYYRCIFCKISDPQINGRLEGHTEDCLYRRYMERTDDVCSLIEDLEGVGESHPCYYEIQNWVTELEKVL